ncbi:chemotaxis protein CheW [Herbaspirillum frisingense]|uniref:chemotaxis protein CheW n=1 Tax=Herbaspirillum frisingense TaxID=92645 RepID=UPI0015FFCCF5|nr:chemotaxis protein CheW [Herbaspirillum frisingense]QNB08139.1 chemotaxis protein CheW [Herbaspirillum frisingense]
MSESLFLLFSLGAERYALSTAEVALVLPLSPCKALPGAPPWVAGLLPHGDGHVPVIDLSHLALGRAAAARVSTRLVLLHYHAGLPAPQLLGLILEQATETLRCDPAGFAPAAVRNEGAPYLGPVRPYQGGLLQRVQVEDLLDPATRALLFPQEPA